MGLDITYYANLKERPDLQFDDSGDVPDYETQVNFHHNTDFPGRAEGVKEGVIYEYSESDGFRAGSYGGYNHWRDWLAKVAGYKSAEECWNSDGKGPLYEFIHFSDCEGVIGPVVSAKLAKELAALKNKAEEAAKDTQPSGYYMEKFNDWLKAFETAAQGGAVDFH